MDMAMLLTFMLLVCAHQVCDSSSLCPGALEVLKAAVVAATSQAGGAAAAPPPELLAKLLAALTGGALHTSLTV
jgi:hypothetical protein